MTKQKRSHPEAQARAKKFAHIELFYTRRRLHLSPSAEIE